MKFSRYNPEDIVGKKIKSLLVLKHLGMRETYFYRDRRTGRTGVMRIRYYLCRCKCGREKEIPAGNLKTEIGCRYCKYCIRENREKKKEHPMRGMWKSIKRSGVYVCDEWQVSFEAFIKDTGEPPSPEHKIGMTDTSKGYTPDNWKWMTKQELKSTRWSSKELTQAKISKLTGMKPQQVQHITERSIRNKDAGFMSLIERTEKMKRKSILVFKPEAIEYFMNKKYILPKTIRRLEKIVMQYYLNNTDAQTAAKQLKKPVTSILRYYNKFKSMRLRRTVK